MINDLLRLSAEPPVPMFVFVLTILLPAILSYLFFKVYLMTLRKDVEKKTVYQELMKTMILSSSGAAVITMIVGNNLARAFVLVGILHLTRFKANPKRSSDMIYIFCSTVTGILCGSQYYIPAIIFMFICCVYIVIMNFVYFDSSKKEKEKEKEKIDSSEV